MRKVPLSSAGRARTRSAGASSSRCFRRKSRVAKSPVSSGASSTALRPLPSPCRRGPARSRCLLVLLCVTLLVALIGAAEVSLEVAIARFARPGSVAWSAIGGAAGGLLVGAFRQVAGPRRLYAARRPFAGQHHGRQRGSADRRRRRARRRTRSSWVIRAARSISGCPLRRRGRTSRSSLSEAG